MGIWHFIKRETHRLHTRPLAEAMRWRRLARFAVELTRHCWHKFWEDRAMQMAAALTYQTIFGLIPLLVLALLVFRAFGGFQTLGNQLQRQIYDYLGFSSITIQQVERQPHHGQPFATPKTQPAPGSAPGSAPATAPFSRGAQRSAPEARQGDEEARLAAKRSGAREERVQSSDISNQTSDIRHSAAAPTSQKRTELRLITHVFERLNDKVAHISFTSIGLIGLVLLIWAGISLVVTVEDTFNQIYRCPEGRSWPMRIAVYWAVVTLGPVLLMLSIWITTQVTGWVEQLTAGPIHQAVGSPLFVLTVLGHWLLSILSALGAFLASWLLLFMVYMLMPSITVRAKSAAIGSIVAAGLWELAKWGLRLYVRHAVGYSALYGTLGLIPLFLFWLYLSWQIVLFGLELTYVLQTYRRRGLEIEPRRGEQHRAFLDPRWILPVMALIAEAFREGHARTVSDLARRTDLPPTAIVDLTGHLAEDGLLHRVDGDTKGGEPRFALAQAPERIALRQLLDLSQRLAATTPTGHVLPGGVMLDKLHRAQDAAAGDATLADLLEET